MSWGGLLLLLLHCFLPYLSFFLIFLSVGCFIYSSLSPSLSALFLSTYATYATALLAPWCFPWIGYIVCSLHVKRMFLIKHTQALCPSEEDGTLVKTLYLQTKIYKTNPWGLVWGILNIIVMSTNIFEGTGTWCLDVAMLATACNVQKSRGHPKCHSCLMYLLLFQNTCGSSNPFVGPF